MELPVSSVVKPMDETSIYGVEDMILLGDLHEASLLRNIEIRYKNNNVYTFTGNILVAMNPYQRMDIYDGGHIRKYQGKPLGELPPHIFAIGNALHMNMLKTSKDQCVIISGESGAGKTESTKLILNYLATVSTSKNLIQDQILDSIPILEAFGNAKTVRNDNSSRFGKFLEVQFGMNGSIGGALTLQYLLEKSRVVSQSADERNYHIFYCLLSGATEKEKSDLRLQSPSEYRYLNQSGCDSVENIDDVKFMEEVREAIRTLGLAKFEPEILQALAIVLHLGNVNFSPIEVAGMDGVTISNMEELEFLAKLIGTDDESLKKCLVSKTMVTRGETFVTPHNAAQAEDTRDALAKAFYENMFNWLVNEINNRTKVEKSLNFIGILDIFGFEDFKTNSFEQFCINYANERLQYFFNQHIFKQEQDEYEKEGVNWSKIAFVDNQSTIDLLVKKPIGLFRLLDEESNLPRSSDKSFLIKVTENHSTHKAFVKNPNKDGYFGIKHYAGIVYYETDSFLEKNRNNLKEDLLEMIRQSKYGIYRKWFAPKIEQSSKQGKAIGKPKTLGYQFVDSMDGLITTLNQCNPYFVRCIKPNTVKKPQVLEKKMVLDQLRNSGMLETIRVRKAGFSARFTFDEFLKRYGNIIPHVSKMDEKNEACVKILSSSDSIMRQDWEVGKSKVFCKSHVETELENLRGNLLVVHVVKLQHFFQMAVLRSKFLRRRKVIRVIQKVGRGYLGRKKARLRLRRINRIQALWRAGLVRAAYGEKLGKVHDERIQREKKEAKEMELEMLDYKESFENDDGKEIIEREEDLIKYLEEKEKLRFSNEKPTRKLKREFTVPSELRRDIQSQNLPVFGPKYSRNFIPFMAYVAPPSFEEANSKNKNTSRDTSKEDISWQKFCRIYFRETAKPRFTPYALNESLLQLPAEISQKATKINRALLLLVTEDPDPKILIHTFNFVCRKTAEMVKTNVNISGGLIPSDETICQALRLTMANPDSGSTIRSWRVLSMILSMYRPSLTLGRVVQQHINQEAPNAIIQKICLQRLYRSYSRGKRQQKLTSIEIISFYKGIPLTMECEWLDGRKIIFEMDSWSTAEDLMPKLAKDRGLKQAKGYNFAVRMNGKDIDISDLDPILDTIAEAEKKFASKPKQAIDIPETIGPLSKSPMKPPPLPSMSRKPSRINSTISNDCKILNEENNYTYQQEDPNSSQPVRSEGMQAGFGVESVSAEVSQHNRTAKPPLPGPPPSESGKPSKELEIFSNELDKPIFMNSAKNFESFNPDNNYPWKLIIKKGFISPGTTLDDPVDIKLISEQLKRDIGLKDSRIPKKEMILTGNMLFKGNNLSAIKMAIEWPGYFTQHFRCFEENLYPDKILDLCIQYGGISLMDVTSGKRSIILDTTYDDVTLVKADPEYLGINICSTKCRLKFYRNEANYVFKCIQGYIQQLKAKSSYAVALVGYRSRESGLVFAIGDLIQIVERDLINGWISGHFKGRSGWFPSDLVEVLISKPKLDDSGKVIMTPSMIEKSKEMNNISTSATYSTITELSMTEVDYMPSSENETTLGRITRPDSDNQGKLSFLEYAQLHFAITGKNNSSIIETLSKPSEAKGKKNPEALWKDIVKSIKFSTHLLKSSLTKLDSADSRLAIECFGLVMQYMGDAPTKKSPYTIAYSIISMGIRKESLRDEIYSQIVKQTTNNKSKRPDSLKKGWDLMTLLAAYVLPSNSLQPYLKSHLERVAGDKTRNFFEMADHALNYLKINRMSSRVSPPSLAEYEFILEKKPLKLRLSLPGGSTKNYSIDTHTTAREILKKLAERFEIDNIEEFGMYVNLLPKDISVLPLTTKDKIADVLNIAESILNQFNSSKNQFTGFKIEYKRKLWQPQSKPFPENAQLLIFEQVAELYMNGKLFSEYETSRVFRETCAQCSALLMRARNMTENEKASFETFIPAPVKNVYTKKEWTDKLESFIQQFKGISPTKAMELFLSTAKAFKLFGTNIFSINGTNIKSIGNQCELIVKNDSISLLELKNRSLVATFQYVDLVNFRCDEEEVVLRANTKSGQILWHLKTKQGPVITDLIQNYLVILAAITAGYSVNRLL